MVHTFGAMLPVLPFIFFFLRGSLLLVPCRTLICTEECLLHPSRNPSLGREGIEAALKEYLGLKKIIWLWKGMAGDDAITNGHVDNLACFVRPGVVALSWTDDVNDPQVIALLHCISIHAYHHVSLPAVPTTCMFDDVCLLCTSFQIKPWQKDGHRLRGGTCHVA